MAVDSNVILSRSVGSFHEISKDWFANGSPRSFEILKIKFYENPESNILDFGPPIVHTSGSINLVQEKI